jgi:anti-anti-sigma factor
MRVHANRLQDGVCLTIAPSGRFDFGMHDAFLRAYRSEPSAKRIVIDLEQVEYMDSAALGMLLVMREELKSSSPSFILANAKGTVRRVLEIANFGRVFTLVG